MEYYELFMKVILKEVAKFNMNIDTYSTRIAKLTAELNVNFVSAYNRCAFMYRYGTVLTYLFNDCINVFFISYSHIKDLFSLWKSYSSVKILSLSTGPGLDFIGFMLAVLEYDSSPPNFEVKVLSKTAAWRNTSNLILEVLSDPFSGSEFSKKPLQYQNLNVIQSDFLQNFSFGNASLAASEADVVFMMKTLNLLAPGATQEGRLVQMFKEFVASLKPKAIIFCLDTKPSIAILTQAISPFRGKFLYGPSIHTAQGHKFPEFNGHSPTSSARGVFFVWQKSPDTLSSNVSAINTSIGTKSKDDMIKVDNSFNKSNASSVENVSDTYVKDSDALNIPWMEFKSFWQRSSPQTKEVLKTLMLTDEERLEHINDFMSQKPDTSENNSLKIFQNSGVEDLKTSKKVGLNTTKAEKSEGTQANAGPSQNELLDDLSMNNQGNMDNNYDMNYYSDGSPSCDSSFTYENRQFEKLFLCKNTSSGKLSPVDLANRPCGSGSRELSEKESKENLEPFLSFENKSIQTDGPLDSDTVPSSVKALTERIRQLTISLESASQQNIFPNGGCHNRIDCDDKPSCSKQPLNMGFKDRDSLPSCHRDPLCRNKESHYSCHCFHNNRGMNCRFKPCCTQSIPRCSFACHHQSEKNHLANVTSQNIVIPLHNISDNTLLQIISILKSESMT